MTVEGTEYPDGEILNSGKFASTQLVFAWSQSNEVPVMYDPSNRYRHQGFKNSS
jgi:hypothetical protein